MEQYWSYILEKIKQHRRAGLGTCPEDCWCWSLEKKFNKIESEEKHGSNNDLPGGKGKEATT